MDKFNFDQLMNIEVPQSCIEKALKIPAETKKAASPVRFYRFAAGIAACVVIAAAVILSLMTGLNKNVDLTNPDPENPSRSDSVYNGTDPSSTDDISSPSILSPLLFGTDAQGSTAVTEPAESSGNTQAEEQNLFGSTEVEAVDFDDGTYDPASEEGGEWEPVDEPEEIAAGEPVEGASE